MDNSISIRKLKKKEAKEVSHLILELYEKWDKIDPIERIKRSWFSSKDQERYIHEILDDKSKLFLVAVSKKKIIGYLLCEAEERKPFLKKVGYIDEAYVEPDYRGKGVASRLLKKAFDWFDERGLTWITLETHSLDEQAISFWENKGFQEFNKVFRMKKGKNL